MYNILKTIMVDSYNSQIYVDRNGLIASSGNIIGKDKIMRIIMNIQYDHDTTKYSEMSSYVDLDIVRRYPDKPWNYTKIFGRLTNENIDIFYDNYFKLTKQTNCKHLTKDIELDFILRTMDKYILYDYDNIIERIKNEKEMELYLYNVPINKDYYFEFGGNFESCDKFVSKITTKKHIRILQKFKRSLSQLDFRQAHDKLATNPSPASLRSEIRRPWKNPDSRRRAT